jgi:hypothetical protein
MSTTTPNAENGTDDAQADDHDTCPNGYRFCPRQNADANPHNTPCFDCFCVIQNAADDDWTVAL